MQMAALLDRLQEALAARYRIERERGAGGMAVVFLAEDLRHHRQVALKVLRPELAAEIGPSRFLREIETAARLSHPHILPLLDSGAAGELLYYAMPYVEGESLRGRLAREKQLRLDDALQIAREVADALSYAHGHGVVHRDIKPENILLQSGHAVVADFGIARAIAAAGDDARTATMTVAGTTLGTPAYMSPEQVAGSRDLDGRSDLYSLGCVLYEMLAGQPPFTGPTVESLVHQHLTAEAPNITVMRPAVPGWVAAAIQRALSKTPADRFNPVAQFAEALAHRESTNTAAAPTVARVPPARRRRWLAMLGGAAAVVAVAVASLLIPRHVRKAPAPGPAPGRPSNDRREIAVLPFQNLSAEGPYAYFASGLHEELLTQLAKVTALKVISRTSVMGYQGGPKPLKQIATELGVGSVVEGSVQVVGGRLRVNVQLIDAATDEHLWAERYDRTLADAFAIQSEVAQKIVAGVGAVLTSAEQGSLAAAPTQNAEAYRLYLQGSEYSSRPGVLQQNLESAQQLYQRALAVDSSFALAHAALSQVHGLMYWWRYDRSEARAARQRAEAQAALRLAPDLPQAHIAMGLVHQWRRSDYRRALDEYAIALEALPNDAELWYRIGSAQRRLGHWSEALAAFDKATRLNPRDADLFLQSGFTFESLHRYPDAIRAFERASVLAPDLHAAASDKAWTYVLWLGQLDTLRAALSRVPSDMNVGGRGDVAISKRNLALWERNADGMLRNGDEALRQPAPDAGWRGSVALYSGWAHQLRGDRLAARAAFDAARVSLDSALVGAASDDWGLHSERGLALARLGRRDEALREARWLQQSEVYRHDAMDGPNVAESRAQILAQTGDADAALDEIERLLVGPSWLSVHTLQLDPRWDPIREHPRFKALLAKYGSGAVPGAVR
jgi:serine/threonine-protein kinase